MDLGKKLRDALAKIANLPVVDEAAVKGLIKELQRTLISSDVNVKLVFELSKRIERRALHAEKMEALTLREHVLKVVYDELIGLMGESYEPRVDRHKVLLLGLYGSGKCVHGDSLIPLGDGNVRRIQEIYEDYAARFKAEETDGGQIIKCGSEGPIVYSMNQKTLKMEKKAATILWKLKKDSRLIRIRLNNGNNQDIIVTPEHPFFVLKGGNVEKIRADELTVQATVAAPAYLPYGETTKRSFLDDILEKFSSAYYVADKPLAEAVKTDLLTKHGTLVSAFKQLHLPIAYCTFTANIKRGIVPLSLVTLLDKQEFLTARKRIVVAGSRGSVVQRKLTMLPHEVDEELAEFLGYVFGDGYTYKGYVEVTNNDSEILERLAYLGKLLFNIEGRIRIDKRNDVRKITFASVALVKLVHDVFGLPIGKKSRTLRMPDILLKSPDFVLKFFLRGCFDTDGFVDITRRHIEYCSASREFIEQLRVVLLRFGIFSAFSKKSVTAGTYYRLFLRSDDVNTFAEKISTVLPRKRKRMDVLLGISGQGQGRHQMIDVGKLLKSARQLNGISIGELQHSVNSYGIYEHRGEISRVALKGFLNAIERPHKNWLAVLKNIKNSHFGGSGSKGWMNATISRLQQQNFVARAHGEYSITPQGEEFLDDLEKADNSVVEQLRLLALSDVCWMKVKDVETADGGDYVYDLTVEENHSFIANGIVVHNTTSASKVAYFYKSRGLSVALVGADVERPAAQEQLRQLAKKIGVRYYTTMGEKDAAKVVEKALKESKEDVIIVDSAGRSAFDSELEWELRGIADALRPDENYLVLNADIGQIAGKQAGQFSTIVPLTGVIVTKMDGSGKGGGALSAVAATKTKIAFIGVGEKTEDLEIYDAKRFVSRLLGMPDIKGLVEKVEKIHKEEELEEIEGEELTIGNFYKQLKAAKKMGPLGNVLGMMGMSDLPKEVLATGEEKMKKYEAMINSMTKAERKEASLLRKSNARIERVAKGAGCSPQDVKSFLNEFEKMEKMMNMFRKNRGFRKQMEKFMKGGNLKGLGI